MDTLYIVTGGGDMDDSFTIYSHEEAIVTSQKYPHIRIEIFKRVANTSGYVPTNCYYQRGKYHARPPSLPEKSTSHI